MAKREQHEAAAGILCVDDGTGCCRECGAAPCACETCKGVGYHHQTCPEGSGLGLVFCDACDGVGLHREGCAKAEPAEGYAVTVWVLGPGIGSQDVADDLVEVALEVALRGYPACKVLR